MTVAPLESDLLAIYTGPDRSVLVRPSLAPLQGQPVLERRKYQTVGRERAGPMPVRSETTDAQVCCE
jgi:hypothetical protein